MAKLGFFVAPKINGSAKNGNANKPNGAPPAPEAPKTNGGGDSKSKSKAEWGWRKVYV